MLAHRGLALDALENTAGAFDAALELGVRHIETDVHVTRDGVAVLWHDRTLARFNGRRMRLDALDWADLAKLRAPGGEVLLRLDEALRTFSQAALNIDVKVEAASAAVVQAVRLADAADRVLLTSFSEPRRRRLATALSGVATSAGSSAIVRLVSALAVPNGLARWPNLLAGAVALQVPERQHGVRIVTPRFIAAAHEHGVEVHVWTVNDPADMRRLVAMGVDGIVTDRADLAQQQLG